VRRSALVWIAVFVGAALISGFTILRSLDPFDEGLALQAARRVASGEMPYGDFLWGYGPGAPYLFAALGESLLNWRIVRVLVDAGIATVVFALVRRETGSTPWALAAWLVAACAIAQPRSANPAAFALCFALLAFAVGTTSTRRAIAAGVLIALAAAFRIDFAAFGLAALLVASRDRRAATVSAGAALVAGLLVYLPFALAVGPGDLYDALIGTSLREGSYWTLPFPLDYNGGLSGPAEWKDALDFYVPLLLLIGAAAVAVSTVLRWRSGERAPLAAVLGLLVLAAGLVVYMRSRTDAFHAQPLEVVLAVLLPLSIVAGLGVAGRGSRVLGAVLVVVFVLLGTSAVGNRVSALVQPPELETVDVAVADGVQAPPADADSVERTVALVQDLVPPDEPIYVLPRRSDLAPLAAPLVYVLTDRDNPTPRDHGLLTGEAAQREIVAELESARPRALVRWTDPLSSRPEPNERGRPSGVRIVDDWVAANYRLRQRAGYYDVLVPRRASP
jgi:hypothetical protein